MVVFLLLAEPDWQFQLVLEHIECVCSDLYCTVSRIKIFVERNLGFEAEHHHRALGDYPGVEFHTDSHAQRIRVLTTNEMKHAMCSVLSTMMREKQVHIRKPIHSRDPVGNLVQLLEQMEIYSYQFKVAQNTFTRDKIELSGKVGGMKDDLCICLQLGAYWTNVEVANQQLTCIPSVL